MVGGVYRVGSLGLCFDCLYVHTQGSISESCLIRPNLDCNYTYQSDFEQNENSFGAKSL